MTGTPSETPPPTFRGRPRWVWVAAAAGAVAVALALWRFAYIPHQISRHYALGYQEYLDGNISGAVEHLRRVRSLDPDLAGARMLLGWGYWRQGHPLDAEENFQAAFEQDPTFFDAQTALGMARLALGDAEGAITPLEAAADARPTDDQVRRMLAEAYRETGRNLSAAELYKGMLAQDSSDYLAETALLEIFGYPSLNADSTARLPERSRPVETQVGFRTRGDHFQVFQGGRWRTTYLTGVNLGPGRPGEFAVNASLEFETYRGWLRQIDEMNANTVRVYTILPPAFYQAFLAHNQQAAQPLWLIQEVWLADDAMNLYDPETKEAFEEELRNTIDLLHGQADIACRVGHYCGVYTADVSRWVVGIGVGREVEPRIVLHTNRKNPQHTSFEGTYVSLDEGTPSEVWFAEQCNRAASYEMERYNAQRPLTVVNWPPLDPMHHPTEATYGQEIRFRRQAGELVADSVPEDMNDMDVVTIDITRFRAEPAFRAGLFALYHVYQHWPDFLFLDPTYAEARDAEGVNRYIGYLLDLKAAHEDFPLLIGEYGLATSIHPVHLHPQGWHNGGLTEEQQARLLERFTHNIRDTQMAGGIVFEWVDEWWKQVHDEFVAPMEPRGDDPLWLNGLDPEEHFGVVGYRAFPRVPLLTGQASDWEDADTLYTRGADEGEPGPGDLTGLYVTSDYTFLYLRLDVRMGPGFSWDDARIQIPLNTLPGRSGSNLLQHAGIQIPSGANFVVELDRPGEGRILVARNYDPWGAWQIPGRPDQTRTLWKANVSLGLDAVPFQAMRIEANPPRWSREGHEFPALDYDRSPMPYGTAEAARSDFDSRSLWHVSPDGMIEIRLPWSLILVMDPTKHLVFGGTDRDGAPLEATTPGISVAALVLREGAADGGSAVEIVSGFPTVRRGLRDVRLGRFDEAPAVYTWTSWARVRYSPYFKPSYYALQELWGSWPRFLD